MILELKTATDKMDINQYANHSQNLLPCGNGKLCFAAQKMLFVPQNQLAHDFKSRGIASGVGNYKTINTKQI